jgi:hypothetical protein
MMTPSSTSTVIQGFMSPAPGSSPVVMNGTPSLVSSVSSSPSLSVSPYAASGGGGGYPKQQQEQHHHHLYHSGSLLHQQEMMMATGGGEVTGLSFPYNLPRPVYE